jgi:Ser/Thr protein kinase RdoA (MazF antagonist)
MGDVRHGSGLDPGNVPAILRGFGLGSDGTLSGRLVAGRRGAIWRLETADGAWAVKQVDDASSREDVTALLEGAAFQDAAVAAGVSAPAIRRTMSGDVIGDVGGVRVTVQRWVDLAEPHSGLDPAALGHLVAGLHRVHLADSDRHEAAVDPWYWAPVGRDRWRQTVAALAAADAPFADELLALVPELLALERLLGDPPGVVRTCHRDLWADNLRAMTAGGLCVIDFDNAGPADHAQELALVLVEFADGDAGRAMSIREAYAAAGGPGLVRSPADFAMPIAQVAHIVETGCRRWLAATTDAGRADNEAWVREYLERPLTRAKIEAML